MRSIVFLLLLLVTSSQAFCQTVANVLATVDGDNVRINYNLAGEPTMKYDIRISYSVDDESYKPIKKASGDISQQLPGTGKTIIWQAKDELAAFNGFVRFKVELVNEADSSKKETIAKTRVPNNLMTENEHFRIEFVSAEKTLDGFTVTVIMQSKSNMKSSFTSSSYSIDELNKVYKLASARISGTDVSDNKYQFFSGNKERLELTFENRFADTRGGIIEEFAVYYTQGLITLNLYK